MFENESRIILKSMEVDSFKFLNKNLSRLYSICVNKGFQEELFKIGNLAWKEALSANVIKYSEEIKKLYSFIHQNFYKILSYIDLLAPKYQRSEEYDDFIRNFLITLFDGETRKAEILIETFITDDEKRKKVYEFIFYPSICMIKYLYEAGYVDEIESYLAFSVLNKTLSSIYIEKDFKKKSKCFSIYVPIENIIGEKILNFYNRFESRIFSDILLWHGIDSLTINAKEIAGKDFNYEPCFACFFGVSPYNLNLFKNFAEMVRAKSSTCRIIVFSEDLENIRTISNYGDLMYNTKEALEVIKNA